MLKLQLLTVFSVLSFSVFSFSQSPLILKPNETVIFQGHTWDTVTCDKKTFSKHDYNITLTEIPADCNCDKPS